MVSPNGGHGSGVGTSNVHVLKASAASKLLVTGSVSLERQGTRWLSTRASSCTDTLFSSLHVQCIHFGIHATGFRRYDAALVC